VNSREGDAGVDSVERWWGFRIGSGGIDDVHRLQGVEGIVRVG
jgi:hypothetical protein